jgi:hypothetical protein
LLSPHLGDRLCDYCLGDLSSHQGSKVRARLNVYCLAIEDLLLPFLLSLALLNWLDALRTHHEKSLKYFHFVVRLVDRSYNGNGDLLC